MRPTLRVFALLLVSATTCTPSALQVQARLANAVALAGNRTLPALIQAYRADGLRVIAEGHAAGLPREGTEQRLAAHVAAWRPVWGDCDDDTGECSNGAWPAVRATHEAWARALEAQIASDAPNLTALTEQAAAMHRAFCALRGAVPLPARTSVPEIPGAPCP